jgi:phospholipid transport system substrate-binding protein
MTGITRRLALAMVGSTMVLALAGAPVMALAADPVQARQFIERSAAQVRGEAASVKAAGDARARFGALFVKSFDIDALARNVLGARWTALNPTQQGDFRTAFQAYVIKAYADRFYTYAGQPMTVLTSDAAGNGTLVRTRVQMPSGSQTPVDWQVSEVADGLRIADVAIDGVSLTRTHRDEFTSVIQANGGDVGKLTAMLRDRSR